MTLSPADAGGAKVVGPRAEHASPPLTSRFHQFENERFLKRFKSVYKTPSSAIFQNGNNTLADFLPLLCPDVRAMLVFMEQTTRPPDHDRQFSILASQLARLGWSGPKIHRFERVLEANKEALKTKAEQRRREAEFFRFCIFVLARRSEAEPWKKRYCRHKDRK